MPDEMDLKLIRELQNDSRQINTEVAAKLGISESTVRRRIVNLVRKGMVKFTVIINPEALGFPLSAHMAFQIQPDKIEEVAGKIAAIDALYSVSVVAGRWDIVTSGYFRSMGEIYKLVSDELGKIQGIIKTETMIILQRTKREY